MSYRKRAKFQERAHGDPTESTMERVDRFQLDFSGKPHTACKTLNSGTSSTELITRLFLLSLNNSKTLGFTHLSTHVHQNRDVWRLAMNKEIPVPGRT